MDIPEQYHEFPCVLELVNQGTFPNEDTTELDNITLSQKNIAGNNTGTPSFFYLTKNRLVILPTPDSAKRINLYYSQKVSDLTADGETMDIPEQYHEFPCVLAAIDGLLKDGRDPTPMLEKRNYYKEMLEEDAEDREENQARGIVVTEDDGYGVLF